MREVEYFVGSQIAVRREGIWGHGSMPEGRTDSGTKSATETVGSMQ